MVRVRLSVTADPVAAYAPDAAKSRCPASTAATVPVTA
jgi:hypothetical protein